MKALLLLFTAAGVSAAATLDAQGVAGRPDSSCTKFSDGNVECRVYRGRMPGDSAFGNRIFMRMDSAMEKRAALGLQLRATGTRRDTLGVFVDGVTPKGPAENAGIVEGDRIAAINGVDLRTPAADIDDSYSNGLASHRLSREVHKLTPGTRVSLRVYSGGRVRDVQVVAGKATDVMRLGGDHFHFGFPGGDGMMEFGGPEGGMMMGPDMQIFRDRVEPLIRDRVRRLQSVPRAAIRLRGPVGFRTTSPVRLRRVMKGEGAAEGVIQPLGADVIRSLAENAIRDAQSALKQLAADGVV
ncbi:MAG: PDZ domain-containing protein [Gemmatimonadota bacterium]|nr:PDZ domain-containing protein [Gemmatimonadota bacterium]